jgi:tRNA-specific 2-thiouridylase
MSAAAPSGRIAVAMSGGVDSSVAALLLAEAGESVVGLSMQLYDRGRDGRPVYGRCCSPRDLQDARAAADRIGIPFYVVNMEEEFRAEVIDDFLAAYRSGRTPIPCVQCNSAVKFRHLLERATAIGAGRIATGHYARLESNPTTGRWRLRTARDAAKDQSYFLFDLTQEQLSRAMFPLGELTKHQVRALAAVRGLPNADKPESQDICFVPDGDYRGFVRREAGDLGPHGDIVDESGGVLGRHQGLGSFTVGQRRGLGLASGRALYVVALDPVRNRVVVGDASRQYGGGCVATGANWVSIDEPRGTIEAVARIRSTHPGARAVVEALPGRRFRVRFDAPQRAVTPGQAVVLYDGDRLLGGGFISEALPAEAAMEDGAAATDDARPAVVSAAVSIDRVRGAV